MFSGGIGAPELILILVIVLLLFGAKKLPEMARSLGRSSKEFKQGLKDGHVDDEDEAATKTSEKPSAEAGPGANGSSGG